MVYGATEFLNFRRFIYKPFNFYLPKFGCAIYPNINIYRHIFNIALSWVGFYAVLNSSLLLLDLIICFGPSRFNFSLQYLSFAGHQRVIFVQWKGSTISGPTVISTPQAIGAPMSETTLKQVLFDWAECTMLTYGFRIQGYDQGISSGFLKCHLDYY